LNLFGITPYKLFLLTTCFVVSLLGHAQTYTGVDLDTCRVYTDLNLALKNPNKVYRLKLSKKKLTSFPEEIYKLSNLRELNLDRNKISEIPSRITELPKLVKLSLNENRIDTLPPFLFLMKNIEDLQVGDNYITTLPDEIEQLSILKVLAIWDNPIEYYPNSLGSLKQLMILDCLHNQMNFGTQDRISSMFDSKKTKMYFSPPCACDDGH